MENEETPTPIQLQNNYCKIQPTDLTTKRYDVYLNYLISNPHHYFEFLEILRSAGEEDEIHIHLNNNGGYVDTAMQIINSMRESKAKIVTCLEGACHSAASLILLNGDEIKVSEHGSMLCHYYSGGVRGKGSEIESQVEFDKDYYKSFFRKVYANFLTKKEIEELVGGKDFWFSSEDVLKRIRKQTKPKGL
jgi:ATP-dependent protease ClpP protease subunit